MESNLIDRRTFIVGSFAATPLPATFGGTPVFAEEVADQNIDKSNNGWPIQNPDSIVSIIKEAYSKREPTTRTEEFSNLCPKDALQFDIFHQASVSRYTWYAQTLLPQLQLPQIHSLHQCSASKQPE